MIRPVLGIPTHVEQWGSGQEEIVLLHGWGKAVTLDRHLAPLARLLAEDGLRVTALEFPGHGQTGKPGEPWGVPEFGRWTAAALDAMIANCRSELTPGRFIQSADRLRAHLPLYETKTKAALFKVLSYLTNQ